MNTSMADGARDRLVAQIGEALFGQPGLTLMELAEKVKGTQIATDGQSAALHAAVSAIYFDDNSDYLSALWSVVCALNPAVGKLLERDPAAAYEATKPGNTATAAQPSPVSQADALVEAARRVISDIDSGDYHGEISEATYAALQAALTARQPVASNQVVENVEQLGVDGQPVAQEPVAEVSRKSFNTDGTSNIITPSLPLGTKLYAAPPARTVDLPYSLDADPSGIRAMVAGVISDVLTFGAQGHTRPPAGHWAEPFWKAARADAAAQAVDLGQFREAVELFRLESVAGKRDCDKHGTQTHDFDRCIAKADRLLALIDSHAGREPNSERNRLTDRAVSSGQASIRTKDSANG
ncbi:hypothetical protein [Stenotrophomonas sp.]|uniref:hypothetical protein n=1 Tax=Stenotrophomonas sp. TaxID=69392 RepID=UPI002D3B84EB|nr:hypothetical protein [Stenotrophomonas sp.]HYQ23976.1 hypothetical protein [Stenotrophomonas sp.]